MQRSTKVWFIVLLGVLLGTAVGIYSFTESDYFVRLYGVDPAFTGAIRGTMIFFGFVLAVGGAIALLIGIGGVRQIYSKDSEEE